MRRGKKTLSPIVSFEADERKNEIKGAKLIITAKSKALLLCAFKLCVFTLHQVKMNLFKYLLGRNTVKSILLQKFHYYIKELDILVVEGDEIRISLIIMMALVRSEAHHKHNFTYKCTSKKWIAM